MNERPLLVAVALLLLLPGASAASPNDDPDRDVADDALPDERPDALTVDPWSDDDEDPYEDSHGCEERAHHRSADCRHRHEPPENRSDEDRPSTTCRSDEGCRDDRSSYYANRSDDDADQGRSERNGSDEDDGRNERNGSAEEDEPPEDGCGDASACDHDGNETDPYPCAACHSSHPPYHPGQPSIPQPPGDPSQAPSPEASSLWYPHPAADPFGHGTWHHSG